MSGKRFETGVHINIGEDGLVVQQTPGATANPLQILSHDATPMFTIHTSGAISAPMGIVSGTNRDDMIQFFMEVI